MAEGLRTLKSHMALHPSVILPYPWCDQGDSIEAELLIAICASSSLAEKHLSQRLIARSSLVVGWLDLWNRTLSGYGPKGWKWSKSLGHLSSSFSSPSFLIQLHLSFDFWRHHPSDVWLLQLILPSHVLVEKQTREWLFGGIGGPL
jgi:hypothetical protein